MTIAACVRCRARVPVADTTFNADGDYLCRRCTDVADLSETVERARQAALAKAHTQGGVSIIGLIRRWFAVRQAERDHAALVASLPDVENAPTTCSRCGAAVPRGFARCDGCRAAT